jgi:hypothetical protein
MPEKRVYLRRSQDIFREIEERKAKRLLNLEKIAWALFGIILSLTGFYVANWQEMLKATQMQRMLDVQAQTVKNGQDRVAIETQQKLDAMNEKITTMQSDAKAIHDAVTKLAKGDIIITKFVHDRKK